MRDAASNQLVKKVLAPASVSDNTAQVGAGALPLSQART